MKEAASACPGRLHLTRTQARALASLVPGTAAPLITLLVRVHRTDRVLRNSVLSAQRFVDHHEMLIPSGLSHLRHIPPTLLYGDPDDKLVPNIDAWIRRPVRLKRWKSLNLPHATRDSTRRVAQDRAFGEHDDLRNGMSRRISQALLPDTALCGVGLGRGLRLAAGSQTAGGTSKTRTWPDARRSTPSTTASQNFAVADKSSENRRRACALGRRPKHRPCPPMFEAYVEVPPHAQFDQGALIYAPPRPWRMRARSKSR